MAVYRILLKGMEISYEKKKDNQQYYLSCFSMCLRTGNDLSVNMDGNELL